MSNFTDMSGRKYGKLTIAWPVGRKPVGGVARIFYLCVCDCGKFTIIQPHHAVDGNTRSCGCGVHPHGGNGPLKHGHSRRSQRSITYVTWKGMIDRCTTKRKSPQKYHALLGVTVCERWRKSFLDFLVDMGERPSRKHSIDRIDTYGNYEPTNCRWATPSEQRRNQRRYKSREA